MHKIIKILPILYTQTLKKLNATSCDFCRFLAGKIIFLALLARETLF